jgi:thiol-disulfide isomerase/thioredoxin
MKHKNLINFQFTKKVIALALAIAFAAQLAAFAFGKDVTRKADNFEFVGPNNRSYELSDLLGHVVVLDFWQSWCPACRRALPSVEALNQELKGKDVLFLGVDDEDRETIDNYSKALKLGFFTISDEDDRIARAYNVSAIPYTVVIGRDGRVVDTVEGYDGNEDRVRQAVQRALVATDSDSHADSEISVQN